MEYTLTFSEQVSGWPSFYSFKPDWMIGVNSFFYTFKGGNLYLHNSNETRNTFYLDWWTRVGNPSAAFVSSKVKSVFNEAVLENKLFKTINIEGDAPWDITLETDLQLNGYITGSWFERKEASYFAFVRNSGGIPATETELRTRSTNGIGKCYAIDATDPANVLVDFQISPSLISLGGIISIGDYVYYTLPPAVTPILFGSVKSILVDYPSGLNRLIIDSTIPLTTVPGIQNPYILYTKNSVAESHGVLGYYCVFEAQNAYTTKVELFVVQSDVMKSYP